MSKGNRHGDGNPVATVETAWSHDGTVATVAINRPQVRNALDFATMEAIGRAFEAADAEGARVIVLRGNGPSFCSGADLRSYPGPAPDEPDPVVAQSLINIGNRVCSAVARTNAVTVAVIHGHAIGGGLALALACDMRLVAEDATLALPELRLGLPLGWGALYRSVALMGAARTWEMLATGRSMSGMQSITCGLCGHACPAADLDKFLEQRLNCLLSIESETLILTKRQFRAVAQTASSGDLEQLDGALLTMARRLKPAKSPL